jgi:prepilin-type N-terminal cleavage/methylation domain-containing protein
MKNRDRDSRSAGFTMIELMVVLALAAILMSFGIPALINTMRQGKLRGVASSTLSLMRQARLDAIKTGGQGVIQLVPPEDPDVDQPMVLAYSDRNSNLIFDDGEPEIGRIVLPNGVRFLAPPEEEDEDSVFGFTEDPENDINIAVFTGNGSIRNDGGAFRFGDNRGNFLEVRVMTTAGQMMIRKCRVCEANDPDDWYVNKEGEEGEAWTWK